MSETGAGTDAESETDAESATEAETATDESDAPTQALERLEPLLLVAVGGFAGAALRYAVVVALSGTFPWGTLAVNVAGSFALGVLLYEAKLVGWLSPRTRVVLGTGFLSSFTTYSTFAVQTAALSPTFATANVGANYALSFLAVVAGRAVVRSVTPAEVTR